VAAYFPLRGGTREDAITAWNRRAPLPDAERSGYKLFLDDERNPPTPEWLIACSSILVMNCGAYSDYRVAGFPIAAKNLDLLDLARQFRNGREIYEYDPDAFQCGAGARGKSERPHLRNCLGRLGKWPSAASQQRRCLRQLGHHRGPLDKCKGTHEQMLAHTPRLRPNGRIEKALRFLSQFGWGMQGLQVACCHESLLVITRDT
jgi:hypothetical protein